MMYVIALCCGFFIGWVACERPVWATNAINWLKGKIGL